MKVRLTESWELTEEEDPFRGKADLVSRRTGEAFGPGAILGPYAYWDLKPAAVHVIRMANMEEHTREEKAFIQHFSLPEPVLSGLIPA